MKPDFKVSLSESQFFDHKNRTDCLLPQRLKRLLLIAGAFFLLGIIFIVALTFQTIAEIRKLRYDVEDLRRTVNKSYNYNVNLEYYEDNVYPMKKPSEGGSEDFSEYEDSYYDDIYTEVSDNSNEVLETITDPIVVVTGQQFTKDAKESKRTKRTVIGYTNDGVPINSESFAEALRRNNSLRRVESTYPNPDSYQYTSATPDVYSRKSRVMHQEDKSKAFKQVVKKSSLLKSGDNLHNPEEDSETEFTIVRTDERVRHRPHHVETFENRPKMGRMRPLPTAHFSGDTSKYILGQHENFNGNAHMRHPQDPVVDWTESSWFHTLGMDRHFGFTDGVLTIKESGLYFVYAQIYYWDEHDTNTFSVFKNRDTLLQCTTMTHTVNRIMKGNSCYTAAAEYLLEGDRISVGGLGNSRYTLFEPGKSFFGVIKLGDVKIK